ncbi:hypothetical protein BFU36_01070 [Sulfolobus sp. A20]|uniref:hypothetical protein n=1 Tax=Sulfolobaceae TaxID=118883 RepID=UPI000845FBB3|nr:MULTISPECIES: hypothetical protein [unclassified Sulfolobus]AOL15556.1 hypothetical protein BFU36_01070 [Sulfolobus sp. A20]TRM83764.1 hypothetical protein DJ531_04010 [Sulfolobus sp. A20-N-F6]TRM92137.1 hypothetical protein DJ526_06215 [Sulfolobus sp. A20-N-G8]TRM98975.1 hypothetical protein DJ530_09735 [Sulfolobus sp. E1]
MKLNGIDISSIISSQTAYVATTYEFIEIFAEDFPTYISLDVNGRIIRKLIVLSRPRINFSFYPNYKYIIEKSNFNDNYSLQSLKDAEKILIYIKATRKSMGNEKVMQPIINFLGLKNDKPSKLLVVNDIPIVTTNRKEELISQTIEFIKQELGLDISTLPTIVNASDYREIRKRGKVKIVDVDYYQNPLILP